MDPELINLMLQIDAAGPSTHLPDPSMDPGERDKQMGELGRRKWITPIHYSGDGKVGSGQLLDLTDEGRAALRAALDDQDSAATEAPGISVPDKQRIRDEYLLALYEATGGNPRVVVSSVDVGKSIGLDESTAKAVTRHLSDRQLVRYRALGGKISITTAGVDRAESLHMPAPTEGDAVGQSLQIGNVSGIVNVVQGGGPTTVGAQTANYASTSSENQSQDGRRNPDIDRALMQRAIDLSRNCKSEDDKNSPKVGALVARDGAEIDSAYRGEQKDGDHAEYTLLEKKLPNAHLAGAVLYTTLEPCTKRGEGKVPCAERIAEHRIGKVVIGTVDPNPEIRGTGIMRLRDAGIEVAFCEMDQMAEIEELNREFRRQFEDHAPTASADGSGPPDMAELNEQFVGVEEERIGRRVRLDQDGRSVFGTVAKLSETSPASCVLVRFDTPVDESVEAHTVASSASGYELNEPTTLQGVQSIEVPWASLQPRASSERARLAERTGQAPAWEWTIDPDDDPDKP